jgi:hypothetical protein
MMLFFSLMFLRATFLAHLFWIRFVCTYSIFTVNRNFKVPQPDVFLLPMQSVGTLTSLTKIIFRLRILISLSN